MRIFRINKNIKGLSEKMASFVLRNFIDRQKSNTKIYPAVPYSNQVY